MTKKPSMGRQKIKIQKIEVKNHLQVTFSKRRSGLFKKASELCTLCGVEITIIVFSPAGKVFSFGHPNVETIIDRFLARKLRPDGWNANPNMDPLHLVEAQRNASVRELNLQLGQILNELEIEGKRGENLDCIMKTNQSHYWWESPVSKLGLEELEQLREAMEDLKKNVTQQAGKMMNLPMALSSILGLNGPAGVYDHCESKPSHHHQTIMLANNITGPADSSNFGYCHGFF